MNTLMGLDRTVNSGMQGLDRTVNCGMQGLPRKRANGDCVLLVNRMNEFVCVCR